MRISHFHAEPAYPPSAPPSWAGKVERWYQLDPFAFLLPAAFSSFPIESRPSSMILACEGASNFTDRAFVEGGATSPAKFVHTLPNIRSSSLLAVMGWYGPIFTLQRDPLTLSFAFEEAAQRGDECWVWTVSGTTKVDLFVFGCAPGRETHVLLPEPGKPLSPRTDVEILRSFWDSDPTFSMGNWVVRKI